MPRAINKLSAILVSRRTLKPGHYSDGGGLYLQVSESGSKSWVFRYQRQGRRGEVGLGALGAVTLAEAREKAAAQRALLASGKDPLTERRAALASGRGSMTFAECAEAFIKAHAPGWRNAKHGDQWRKTLTTYAFPVIGDLPVSTIDTTHVLKVLEPIWTEKTETAKRLRGRIENVLDWATARRFRAGENPARWRGHLDKLLARPSKVAKVQHHAALPYADVPAFFSALQEQAGVAALALRFCVLTATRSGETLGAKWSEIDEAAAVWTVTGDRTKSGRDHRVPLSDAALAIIAQQRKIAEGEYVFAGAKRGKPLSNMAMAVLLRRMQRDDLTVHGFRSSFRDWAGECTNFPREVVEAALAHVLRDKTEAAYARGDLFEKRRRLMAAWAKFCTKPAMPARVFALKTG